MRDGDVIVVRYADDTIVGFEHQREAERLRADLKARFVRFGLTLHPDKTRLIEFGRPQLRIDLLGVSVSRSCSTSSGSRIIARPVERLGFRALEETGGQANARQASRDQGAAHGHRHEGIERQGLCSARFCAAAWPIILCR